MKLDEADRARDSAIAEKNNHILSADFAQSKFIEEKVASAAKSLLFSKFGPHFTVKDGKSSAVDAKGNEIFSRENPGELAGIDEALEVLINADSHRDDILKATTKPGAGGDPNPRRSTPGQETAELHPTERLKAARRSGATA